MSRIEQFGQKDSAILFTSFISGADQLTAEQKGSQATSRPPPSAWGTPQFALSMYRCAGTMRPIFGVLAVVRRVVRMVLPMYGISLHAITFMVILVANPAMPCHVPICRLCPT